MNNNQIVKNFISHLSVERGLSQNTVNSYLSDLKQYTHFLQDRSILQASEKDVQDYAVDLSKKLSKTSVARKMSAVKQLYKFLLLENLIENSPASQYKSPKTPQKLPKALTVDQVNALLNAPNMQDIIGIRDKALLELLYGCGLRITEAVKLTLDNFIYDKDNSCFLRVLGKGSKERLVPVGKYALDAIEAYISRSRPALSQKSTGTTTLFLNKRGKPLSRQSAWEIIQYNAKRASISANISPHTLRHCYATHLLEGGADIRVVQELLGHANVTTTQIYTKVTITTLRQVYATTHPRAK